MEIAERIEKYLSGELSPEEVKQLLHDADNDPALKKEILLCDELRKYMENEEKRAFYEKVKKAGEEYQANRIHRKRISYRIAAAFALLLGIGSAYYFTLDKGENKQPVALTENFYQTPEAISFNRGDATPGKQDLADAMDWYGKRNYKRALEQFEKLEKVYPSDPVPAFFAGVCCIETEEFRKATVHFGRLDRLPENPYTYQSAWFSGLCYLRTGDVINGKSWIEKAAQHSRYREKAKKILDYLAGQTKK